MDVVAKTKCICFSISIGTLINMLGEKYRTYLYLGFIKSSFATSSLFQRFNSYLIEQIFELFKAVPILRLVNTFFASEIEVLSDFVPVG